MPGVVVNTTTSGSQTAPDVAVASDGTYVIVWQTTGANGFDIYMQRYDSAHNQLGSETLVNTTVTGSQTAPAVAYLTNGTYVVAWTSDGSTYLQMYNANGTVIGTETAFGTGSGVDITGLTGGGFVVTWTGTDTTSSGVYAKLYDSSGAALTAGILVNTDDTGGYQGRDTDASVTALVNGGFGVAWSQHTSTGVRFFDSSGVAQASEITIASNNTAQVGQTPSTTKPDIIQLTDGSFVVSFAGDGFTSLAVGDGKAPAGYFQRIDASYAVSGSPILFEGKHVVDGDLQGAGGVPVLAASDDGGFQAFWRGYEPAPALSPMSGQTQTSLGVYSRHYNAAGVGGVTQYFGTGTFLSGLAIAAIPGGGFQGVLADGTNTIDVFHMLLDVPGPLTSGDDYYVGTSGNDVISGLVGVDTVDGGAGNDTITADTGATNKLDWLYGGAGDDVLDTGGTSGMSVMYGGTGNDTFLTCQFDFYPMELAGEGTDTLLYWGSNLFIMQPGTVSEIENLGSAYGPGGVGHLDFRGNELNNVITTNTGNDLLSGGLGADTLNGSDGMDQANYIYATSGVGVDMLLATAGVSGEAAGDIYINIEGVNGSNFDDSIEGDTAANRLYGNGGADFIFGDEGDDVITGNDANDLLGGWTGNDWIEGGAGVDWLSGGDGDDRLDGGTSGDTLDGQAGIDVMIGGLGDDVYHVDNFYDDVRENAAEGVDIVYASVNWGIRDNVESLFLTGMANIDAYGNGSANTLVGNDANNLMGGFGGNDWMEGRGGVDWLSGGDGNDRLEGGAGNDTLEGQAGWDTMIGGLDNDVYFVDDVADEVRENVGEGNDIVFTSVSWTIAANVETVVLTGLAAINGYGSAGADTVAGNDAANVITGIGGADWIEGKGGNDWLEGGEGADRIDGGADNDRIDGGGGVDTLFGGAGLDTFVFNAASDSPAAGGSDSIRDFERGADRINIAALHVSGASTFNILVSGGSSYVRVDVNGDGTNDFVVEVAGIASLSAADLIW